MDGMFKNMLKNFIPSISEKLTEADPFIAKTLNEQELNPGEDKAVFMLTTGKDGIAWVLTVALKGDEIIRIINKVKLTEFIQNLLKQL